MKQFKGKKVLIVGLGKTGFVLIKFFQQWECSIKVTDIKPIFDLNKVVKKLKKIIPNPAMTFGEHLNEDFLEADIIVYSAAVKSDLPQLELARRHGKEVCSDMVLAAKYCDKPIIAVCGHIGRTTLAHMVGFCLKLDGKNAFVGGGADNPLINYSMLPDKKNIDYIIVEISAVQMDFLKNFSPEIVVFTGIGDTFPEQHFTSMVDYVKKKLSIVQMLSKNGTLIVNFDRLVSNGYLRNTEFKTYWYTRKSFMKMGVGDEYHGTQFHNKKVQCDINYLSEFNVARMRIVGRDNRESLLGAITVCKVLGLSDRAIQACVEKFPGIPHRLEFLIEKNGVCFYNDSSAESMKDMVKSISSFKRPVVLVVGGREMEDVEYEEYATEVNKYARVLVLVGESKERMNRALGTRSQTYIVGSFEESILFAYQKSRMGETIILSPGAPATDIFRDYEERGNYFKKLVYQF